MKVNVGRMLIGRVSSETLDDETRALFEKGTIGGICIFKENASSVSQLADLVADIWSASRTTPVICVDQEGGAVQRFDHVLCHLPSAMALGATGLLQNARDIAAKNAALLRALGFNCVLSPVLDVATHALNPIIGTRAFSSDPHQVSRFGRAMFEAFAENGIVAVGKHFPGHGSTREDSHSELAVNHFSEEDFEKYDLAPFVECLKHAPALLSGHIWVSSIEKEPVPATLSKRVGLELLRGKLSYDGAVFTDDMMMKAVSASMGLEEASVRAIEAGADIILLCCGPAKVKSVHEFILKCIHEGRLTERRILDSLRRIERLFPMDVARPLPDRDLSRISSLIQSTEELSHSVSESAITALKGKAPTITGGDWQVLVPDHPRYRFPLVQYLREQVALTEGDSSKPTFIEVRYPVDPGDDQVAKIASDFNGASVIFLTFRSLLNRGQLPLGQALKQASRHLVAVATDTPYDVVALPGLPTYLATYDPSEGAVRALAHFLISKTKDTATCPVDLSKVAVQIGLPAGASGLA